MYHCRRGTSALRCRCAEQADGINCHERGLLEVTHCARAHLVPHQRGGRRGGGEAAGRLEVVTRGPRGLRARFRHERQLGWGHAISRGSEHQPVLVCAAEGHHGAQPEVRARCPRRSGGARALPGVQAHIAAAARHRRQQLPTDVGVPLTGRPPPRGEPEHPAIRGAGLQHQEPADNQFGPQGQAHPEAQGTAGRCPRIHPASHGPNGPPRGAGAAAATAACHRGTAQRHHGAPEGQHRRAGSPAHGEPSYWPEEQGHHGCRDCGPGNVARPGAARRWPAPYGPGRRQRRSLGLARGRRRCRWAAAPGQHAGHASSDLRSAREGGAAAAGQAERLGARGGRGAVAAGPPVADAGAGRRRHPGGQRGQWHPCVLRGPAPAASDGPVAGRGHGSPRPKVGGRGAAARGRRGSCDERRLAAAARGTARRPDLPPRRGQPWPAQAAVLALAEAGPRLRAAGTALAPRRTWPPVRGRACSRPEPRGGAAGNGEPEHRKAAEVGPAARDAIQRLGCRWGNAAHFCRNDVRRAVGLQLAASGQAAGGRPRRRRGERHPQRALGGRGRPSRSCAAAS